MHEMAIAIDLVRQAEAAALQGGVEAVERVVVDFGELRLVVPEAMQAAFEAAATGTILEEAILEMRTVPGKARCRECGHEFMVSVQSYACPECELANVEIVEGDDIILQNLTCRLPEEKHP